MSKIWKTSQRVFDCSEKTIVMGILNVTPDSFSDGGKFVKIESALRHAERMIEEGADILDVGGESTRPNSKRITSQEEIGRVVPVIKEIKKRFDVAVSVDTSKSEVAKKAIDAGAEIINDISGLRFDAQIGRVAAEADCGLVLMHSRGEFETMHSQDSVGSIFQEVSAGFVQSIEKAENKGIGRTQICLDIGIGFSKTLEQNLELIAKFSILSREFKEYPMLVGVSRKSFLGKILGEDSVKSKLNGTIAANVISVWNGANIIRVHDVRENIEALRIVDKIADL